MRTLKAVICAAVVLLLLAIVLLFFVRPALLYEKGEDDKYRLRSVTRIGREWRIYSNAWRTPGYALRDGRVYSLMRNRRRYL